MLTCRVLHFFPSSPGMAVTKNLQYFIITYRVSGPPEGSVIGIIQHLYTENLHTQGNICIHYSIFLAGMKNRNRQLKKHQKQTRVGWSKQHKVQLSDVNIIHKENHWRKRKLEEAGIINNNCGIFSKLSMNIIWQ